MAGIWLNASQTKHALVIVKTVYSRVLDDPHRAAVICIETALVESEIQIFANSNVPESLQLPHEAVGSDHLSVGIFQQQVPSWGTTADCMDPAKSTNKFLDRLLAFDWRSMRTGTAAQRVQVSAFPNRYQAREWEATQVVDSLRIRQDWFDMATKAELKAVVDDVVVEHLVNVRADLTKIIADEIEAARHNLAVQVQEQSRLILEAIAKLKP